MTDGSEPPPGVVGPRDLLVDRAREDLAQRLDVDPADVELVEVTDVQWPDGSLGCPRPGMAYPQVVVAGAVVVLRARERTYRYHSGGHRGPFLCERPASSDNPGRHGS